MWKKIESFSYDAVYYVAILYLVMAVFIRENANWAEWVLPVDITLGAFLAREIVTFVWFEDHPEEKKLLTWNTGRLILLLVLLVGVE